jgi:hypothetical protein
VGPLRQGSNVGARTGPPPSLTRSWDRARWHLDAASFPKALGEDAASVHIEAALRFLDARGFLTAAGKRELEGRASALLEEHVRQGARAFLDEAYDVYLARTRYGEPPPIAWLETSWASYAKRFDVTRRVRANALQALIAKTEGRTLDDVLWDIRTSDARVEELRAALAFVPTCDRPLVETSLALNDRDPLVLARTHADPALVLHAARYMTKKRRAHSGLKVAAILAARLGLPPTHGLLAEKLVALGWAVNISTGDATAEHTSWKRLTRDDQRRLSASMEALARSNDVDECALARSCLALTRPRSGRVVASP